MAADWSSLPMDLVNAIAMKLENIEDFIYFSVVCRWWSVISSELKHQWKGTQVPWLLLAENKSNNPNRLRKIYNLHNRKCYRLKLPETFGTRCLGAAYGWVVKIERDLNVQLFNPITKAQIHFPSSATLPIYPDFDKNEEEDIIWFLRSFLKILVLKMCQGDSHEFVIVVLNSAGIAFARHDDQSWTVLSTHIYNSLTRMVDIVAVDNNVFALYNDGTVVYWNFREVLASGVVKPIVFASSSDQVFRLLHGEVGTKYLVHYDGNFLMVGRPKAAVGTSAKPDYATRVIKVFGLDPQKRVWVEIIRFGDVAVFIGPNSSWSISVAMAKHLRRNCVYFTDDECQFWELSRKFGGHDMGVYNMERRRVRRFYKGFDIRSSFCPPTWFIPQL